LRTKPPRFANPPPCPKPPRAKPGVDPATQAAATNTAVKTRFMIDSSFLRRPAIAGDTGAAFAVWVSAGMVISEISDEFLHDTSPCY
jgi:hypothetical protein